ncbi:hypothetical protein FRC09_011092 [Ceratobasidium sp. 395]|nr:hypothetical protein FRC09_011092 [Ceratobasidium sp. 395]
MSLISSSQSSPESVPATVPMSSIPLPASEPAPTCASTAMPEAAPPSVQSPAPAIASAFSSVFAPVSAPAPTSVPQPTSTSTATSGSPPVSMPARTPPPKLPFSLVPAVIPSPVPAVTPGFEPSTPPPCTLPPAPVVVATSASPNPPVVFAGYRVVTHRSSLHQGKVSLMSVSPEGTWIFMSTSDEDRKCFAITRSIDLNLHAVVNTGNVSATAIDWVTDEDYYVGFSDGKIYRARGEENPLTFGPRPDHIAKMMFVTTAEDEGTPSAVTAIAFNRLNGYLAISTSRSVRVFQRRDYDSSRDWFARASGTNEYRTIATVRPFADAEPGINSLAFYGFSRVSLIVGAAAGLAVYSTHESKLKIISALYDYHILKCTVSPDSRMLAAATIEGRVVHWRLSTTGPLFHITSVVTSVPTSSRCSSTLPSVTITSGDAIIGAMPSGYFYFDKPSTGERFIGQTNDRNFGVKAVVAHGGRFYIAGVKGSAESMEIVAYSVNRVDHALRDRLFTLPRLFEPRYDLLANLIHGQSKEVPLKVTKAMVLAGAMEAIPGLRAIFRYLLFFSVFAAIIMLVSGIWNQCIAPLAELRTYNSVHRGAFYLAYTGICLVRNYAPPGFAGYVEYVFEIIFSTFLLIAYRVRMFLLFVCQYM